MVSERWLWDQPPNCAVITDKLVLDDGATILMVAHDLDDHGWQFLSGAEPVSVDARIVSLEQIVGLDPSVSKVSDLPLGCRATRTSATARWQIICRS